MFRSSHTVSGHEAMHLARRLNEELAQQAQKDKQGQRKERAKSPNPDVQSKSYDNQSTQTSGKGKWHCWLCALFVDNCFCFDLKELCFCYLFVGII